MKKIKVLYVITRCTKSGPIQVLENIVKYVDRDRFELYLISINPENEKRTIQDMFSKYFIYQYIPVSKADAIFGRAKKLRKAIEDIQPDVIHSTGVIPDYVIGRFYRDKQLVIAHSNVNLDYLMMCGKVMGTALAVLHKRVMKRARMVIACSESLSHIYAKEGLDMPFIRNGVECQEYSRLDDNERIEARKKLNIPTDKKVLVYAASFNKRKNQEFLINAFNRYYQSDQGIYLLLLGDGPTYEDLSNRYRNLPGVNFQGRVYDVNQYLKISDVFVSSSRQEGMPMGVLEAMALGLPVLLSDIEQHRELFSIDNGIGCMFEEENMDDFAAQLKKLLSMDMTQCGMRAHAVVEQAYSAEKMSMAYQKKYEMIVES